MSSMPSSNKAHRDDLNKVSFHQNQLVTSSGDRLMQSQNVANTVDNSANEVNAIPVESWSHLKSMGLYNQQRPISVYSKPPSSRQQSSPPVCTN